MGTSEASGGVEVLKGAGAAAESYPTSIHQRPLLINRSDDKVASAQCGIRFGGLGGQFQTRQQLQQGLELTLPNLQGNLIPGNIMATLVCATSPNTGQIFKKAQIVLEI